MALDLNGPIGLDVETLEACQHPGELFDDVLHPREREYFARSELSELPRLFRRYWVSDQPAHLDQVVAHLARKLDFGGRP